MAPTKNQHTSLRWLVYHRYLSTLLFHRMRARHVDYGRLFSFATDSATASPSQTPFDLRPQQLRARHVGCCRLFPYIGNGATGLHLGLTPSLRCLVCYRYPCPSDPTDADFQVDYPLPRGGGVTATSATKQQLVRHVYPVTPGPDSFYRPSGLRDGVFPCFPFTGLGQSFIRKVTGLQCIVCRVVQSCKLETF